MRFFTDDDDDDGGVRVPALYVLGRDRRSGDAFCAAAVATRRGWRCRSAGAHAVDHDYVSQESARAVQEWLRDEAHLDHVTRDREDILARLATQLAASDAIAGGLAPDPSMPLAWRAERALRHLERGW